jgi:hypothetical protein
VPLGGTCILGTVQGQVILYDKRRKPSSPILLSCGPASARVRRRVVDAGDGTTGVRRDQITIAATVRIAAGGKSEPLPIHVLKDPQVASLIRSGVLGHRDFSQEGV